MFYQVKNLLGYVAGTEVTNPSALFSTMDEAKEFISYLVSLDESKTEKSFWIHKTGRIKERSLTQFELTEKEIQELEQDQILNLSHKWTLNKYAKNLYSKFYQGDPSTEQFYDSLSDLIHGINELPSVFTNSDYIEEKTVYVSIFDSIEAKDKFINNTHPKDLVPEDAEFDSDTDFIVNAYIKA